MKYHNQKVRRKDASSTSTLTLDNVYILVYDLSLTKQVIYDRPQ